jgi:hypothetical protein
MIEVIWAILIRPVRQWEQSFAEMMNLPYWLFIVSNVATRSEHRSWNKVQLAMIYKVYL